MLRTRPGDPCHCSLYFTAVAKSFHACCAVRQYTYSALAMAAVLAVIVLACLAGPVDRAIDLPASAAAQTPIIATAAQPGINTSPSSSAQALPGRLPPAAGGTTAGV